MLSEKEYLKIEADVEMLVEIAENERKINDAKND